MANLTERQIRTLLEIKAYWASSKAWSSNHPPPADLQELPAEAWDPVLDGNWHGFRYRPVLTPAGDAMLRAALDEQAPRVLPSDAQDLADALAYADEIDRDPTPPTSAMHRWLVVLARALLAAWEDAP